MQLLPDTFIPTTSQSVFTLYLLRCVHKVETANSNLLEDCVWFDPTGNRTQELPDSRQTYSPLRHRGTLKYMKVV